MTFYRTALLTTAIALAPHAVFAADIMMDPVEPMFVPIAAPVFDWTGGYIGGQIGYGWGRATAGTTTFFNDTFGIDEAGSIPGFDFATSGLIGGFEAGVVGDVSAARIRGTYTDADLGFTVDSTINWLSTARVNLGLPFNNFLIYGTGGLAFGGVSNDLHDSYDGGSTIINSTSSSTNLGWTIGAGVAAAISPHWVVKAEYLYVDLGSKGTSFNEPSPGWPLITGSTSTTASIGRVSLDYKF
jgi:outer membrane immunogenic protein